MRKGKNEDEDELLSGGIGIGIGKLPEHLLIEIFIRAGACEWAQISCVRKQWASLLRCECFWQAALSYAFPFASSSKTWPGPIPPGLAKRYLTPSLIPRPSLIHSVIHSFLHSPTLLVWQNALLCLPSLGWVSGDSSPCILPNTSLLPILR